jgi:hypothetical protein
MECLGGIPTAAGAVICFRDALLHSPSIRFLAVDRSGAVRPFGASGGPDSRFPACALHEAGKDLIFWGSGERVKGETWMWHSGEDRWEELYAGEMGSGMRASFRSFSAGGRLFVAGGSGPYVQRQVIAFSPRDRAWRGTGVWSGETPSAGWMGDRAWLWADEGIFFSLETGASVHIPLDGGPDPRERPVCAWTGRELLMFGGRMGPRFFLDAWAYDPDESSWRRLENFPSAR